MLHAEDRQPHHELPNDVRQLVERCLRSAAEIDLLLLLFRSPETFWTPHAAAAVLGCDDDAIRLHLGNLADAGLVDRGKQTDAFRFAPARPQDREAVARLAALYPR
jgi:predicted ArsR family transcriptional regulator